MAAPTLPEVKNWLGVTDSEDDVVLQESLDAALEAQCRVVCYPRDVFGEPQYTNDLREAIFLRTQRLAARRNSPEGVVGLSGATGDFVSARVPATDADIAHLEGPHLKTVVS
jgi:hypothetical protein